METLTIREIAAVCGEELENDTPVNEISTDSRNIIAGCLFIAIKGDVFDGHDFIAEVCHKGAAAVISEKDVACPVPLIKVKDTRRAFLDIAGFYRRKFKIPLIGITGSVGKTTTKEMTADILSEKFKTLATSGNLNNDIGMPHTLLRLDTAYEAAVIEMGMSNMGEIELLSKSAQPTAAIITNIGVSHMENLGSRENILKAKLEITKGLPSHAPLILNGDDPYLKTVKLPAYKTVFFGIENKNCDFIAEDIKTNAAKTQFNIRFDDKLQSITVPAIGIHNVYNALAAFAAGILHGIDAQVAAGGLLKYVPAGMRQRIREINGITIIEDCYNASPDSVKAALNTLADLNASRRISVMGDMLELGKISESAHSELGEYAAQKGIDMLFAYGSLSELSAKSAADKGVKSEHFTDKDELANRLFDELKGGDAVLFKASRSMQLEDVINSLYKRWEANE